MAPAASHSLARVSVVWAQTAVAVHSIAQAERAICASMIRTCRYFELHFASSCSSSPGANEKRSVRSRLRATQTWAMKVVAPFSPSSSARCRYAMAVPKSAAPCRSLCSRRQAAQRSNNWATSSRQALLLIVLCLHETDAKVTTSQRVSRLRSHRGGPCLEVSYNESATNRGANAC